MSVSSVSARREDPAPDTFRALELPLLIFFSVLVLRSAWICDDARITLRVVQNLLNGDGLVWNIGQRVQVYTHPLWMATLIPAVWLTGDTYLTPMALNLIAAAGSVAILLKRIGHQGWNLIAALVLCFSVAFVDYATSGLENALSFLLLALLCDRYFRSGPQTTLPSFLRTTLLFSLILLNRMDLLVLAGPIWAAIALCAVRALGLRRTIFAALFGMVPFAAWIAFSIIYYGFPYPNSAYAKLGHGVPQGEITSQGFIYLLDSLTRDPVTLTAILLATALSCNARRLSPNAPVALGMLLYVVYTVHVGGTFMSGSFLAAPLLLAACIISRIPTQPATPRLAAAAALVVLIGLAAPAHTLSAVAATLPEQSQWNYLTTNGITHERYFYAHANGLAGASRREIAERMHPYRQANDVRRVTFMTSVGQGGLVSGPRAHIIDRVAVADALLACLPAITDPDWSIGHWNRHVPDGLVEGILRRKNLLADTRLRAFADHLDLIISGPIFSAERFQAIWRMNRGEYSGLIDRGAYERPSLEARVHSKWDCERIHVLHSDLSNALDFLPFQEQPVVVYLDAMRNDAEIRMELTTNDEYEVAFLQGRDTVSDSVHLADFGETRTTSVIIKVPAAAVKAGYDRIEIRGMDGKRRHRLGMVLFPAERPADEVTPQP